MTILLFFILLIAVFFIIYFGWLRRWQLRWGATDEEISRPMPGDDIVAAPTFNATRAVTVNAPPRDIFPWIVQMGVTRAGWYSYDLLDNLGRPSARTILPECQPIKIGDLIPMSPDGKHGVHVKDFKPDEWILWWNKNRKTSWVWGFYPVTETQTRLVTRVRVKYNPLSLDFIFDLLIEFCDIIMMRKCMLGIKERAEMLAFARK
ncbi:hypothetical protein hrd7_12210 [Leptolinea sp. HRD-7]|nr:hypothetical protein hrd7_12210 [Leptolinea sp. HRD-7]